MNGGAEYMNKPTLKKRRKTRQQEPISTAQPALENGSTRDRVAEMAGIFADDPLWDEYMEEIRKAREVEDARDPYLIAAKKELLGTEAVQDDVSRRDEHD
jgi:hypothetical protein